LLAISHGQINITAIATSNFREESAIHWAMAIKPLIAQRIDIASIDESSALKTK